MMKFCNGCKTEKDENEFALCRKSKSGRQVYCKICKRQRDKEDYHKGTRKISILRRNKEIKEINEEKLYQYLLEHPCVQCGNCDPIVLEFDHLRDKKKNISQMVLHYWCWETILEEINKCQVLCCNCHRRKTSEEFGWFRTRKNNSAGAVGSHEVS